MCGPGVPRPGQDIVHWSHWPLRDRWPASLLAPLSVLAVVAAVHLSFASVLFDAIAFAALFLSLLKYFLPTRIRAESAGITVRFGLRSRAYGWAEFAGCREAADGLTLLLRAGAAGETREMFLPLPAQRADARQYVQSKIG